MAGGFWNHSCNSPNIDTPRIGRSCEERRGGPKEGHSLIARQRTGVGGKGGRSREKRLMSAAATTLKTERLVLKRGRDTSGAAMVILAITSIPHESAPTDRERKPYISNNRLVDEDEHTGQGRQSCS